MLSGISQLSSERNNEWNVREDVLVSHNESEESGSVVTSRVAGVSTVESEGGSDGEEGETHEEGNGPEREREGERVWGRERVLSSFHVLSRSRLPAGVGVLLVGEVSDEEAEDGRSEHLTHGLFIHCVSRIPRLRVLKN